MAKVRICRAVESNVGVRRAYKKQLVKLQHDFSDFILNELFLNLDSDNALAMDSALTPNDNIKELLKAIKTKKLRSSRQNESLILYIESLIGRKRNQWIELLKSASSDIVFRFVRKSVASTTNAQKSALLAAGIKSNMLKERWTVPIVGKQYISPDVARVMPEFVKNNVELITKIGESDVSRIAQVITKGLTEGMNYNELRNELKQTNGFDSARADRVALDQINKINQQVQILNAQSLGCTHARWKHVPGQYTSRKSHIAMDGQPFKLNEGLLDPEVGQKVLPGMLPYCRCVSRLILPDEVINE